MREFKKTVDYHDFYCDLDECDNEITMVSEEAELSKLVDWWFLNGEVKRYDGATCKYALNTHEGLYFCCLNHMVAYIVGHSGYGDLVELVLNEHV